MLYFETYVVLFLLAGVLLRVIAFLMPSKPYRLPGGAGHRYPGKSLPIDRSRS